MKSEWKEVKFRETLAENTRNGLYKPKEFHGEGAKIVNMGELFAYPRLFDVPMRRIRVTPDELKRFGLQAGDLLFARRSLTAAGAGRCSLVCEVNEPTVLESSIIRARPDSQVANSQFLYYWFNSPVGRSLMDGIGRQVAVAGITSSDLVNLSLSLPPLPEQRAIARILSSLDDKIELNRRMNATLEAMAQTLFRAWFVDFEPVKAKAAGLAPVGLDAETAALFPSALVESELGPIPQGWKVRSLAEAFEINPTRQISKGRESTYLDMSNAPTQGHRPAGWMQREFSSGMKFINGDTLLARITPCLENGKTAFVDFLKQDEVGWGSTEFIVLRPCPPLPEYFGYLLCRHEDFRAHAIQSMTGTSGRQRVQTSALGQFLLCVPDEPICGAFADAIQPLAALIAQNSTQSRTLAQVRDSLLPRLISGELRVEALAEDVTVS